MTTSGDSSSNEGHLVLLVDGQCVMCNLCVTFIAERDPEGIVYFETQQSDTGAKLLEKYKQPQDLSTVVMIDRRADPANPTCYTKSTAVLNTLAHLPSAWRYLAYLNVIPAPLRDFGYDVVAASRYYVLGKTDDCGLPSSDARRRIRRAVPEF